MSIALTINYFWQEHSNFQSLVLQSSIKINNFCRSLMSGKQPLLSWLNFVLSCTKNDKEVSVQMAKSKHDPLYIVYGTLLGSLSTLLLYQGITNPNGDADLDVDDAIVAGLGAAILGLLPEVLRLLDNNRPQVKKIHELLGLLRNNGLKVGTLVSLLSVIFSLWSEFSILDRAAISIPVTLVDTLLDYLHQGNVINNNKVKYVLDIIVTLFASFLSYIVSNKMFEELQAFDIEVSNKIKTAVFIAVPSFVAITNLLPIKQQASEMNSKISLVKKMYDRLCAFLSYLAGQSVWLAFMAAIIQMKLIEQFMPEPSIQFEDAMGLVIVDSIALMPYFEALLREYQNSDEVKKIQSLDFIAEVLKGAIISLCLVAPGMPIPAPLLFSTTTAGAVSYFLPQINPPAKLKKLHGAVSGLLDAAIDSAVAVGFIRTLFVDLIPKTLTPGIYAALFAAILFDMFVFKPAADRGARPQTSVIFKCIRVLRNAALTLGFANSAEEILKNVIETFLNYSLPLAVNIASVAVAVVLEAGADIITEDKAKPKLLAVMRGVIVFYGLLQGWYDAFHFVGLEDSKASFGLFFGMVSLLSGMTCWFSNSADSLAKQQELASEPFNAAVDKLASCQRQRNYISLN